MTGRGIDQILPHPSPPQLHEPYVKSAFDYVALAERANGPIPRPVSLDYVWGDALAELDRYQPDLRIINLETAITTSEDLQPKGINYRMHPVNVPCLTVAGIDCCVLANNHVMDWGAGGLLETLATLEAVGIRSAGAGRDRAEAAAPAILSVPAKGRVLVYAVGTESSGVPASWAAGANRPGVWFLPDLSAVTASRIAAALLAQRQPGDLVVLSVHWGRNWGYEIPHTHTVLAHRLIDAGAVDILFGHSSHHPRAIEIYRGKPILYGCGDLLNDYEGIGGHEAFRDELVLMYFVLMDRDSGLLERLEMAPLRLKRFRLNRPTAGETDWMAATLDRECRAFGAGVERTADGGLRLLWTS